MKKFFKIASLTAIFALVLMATTACGGRNENDLQTILDRGYIIVGIFGESPPFGYVDQAGQLAGRDAMIARRFAYEMFGDEDAIRFEIATAANRIEYLRSFRVDVIIANFTVTEERAEQVDFALPYGRVFLGVIANEGAGIETFEDLAGRSLIVTQGTTAHLYFYQNHPDINLLIFANNQASFDALADGRGDAMAHDNSLLLRHVWENDGFVVIEDRLGEQDVLAPAIRQNQPELLDWLNETTLKLRDEGFFYEVFEQTMREHFHPDTNPSDLMYN